MKFGLLDQQLPTLSSWVLGEQEAMEVCKPFKSLQET